MVYAMFAMVLLTFIVGTIALVTRIKFVRAGVVKMSYFRTMQGQDVPEYLTRTTRSINNMFEVPILFYVVSTLYVSLQVTDQSAVVLAWLFVAARVIHSIIHLTYNKVIHRIIVYWAGAAIMLGMWVLLLTKL